MQRILVIALVALSLAACGSAPAAQVAPTTQLQPTTEPTAAPTPRSLADLDLEPLLIQPGDLPAGTTGGQVRETPPQMFSEMPKAAKTINQQLAQGAKQIGGVTVFLYEGEKDRDAGYALILKGMGTTQAVKVGDDARSSLLEAAGLKSTDLAFRRCHAVVHIRMDGGEENATAYAQRLDKRLQQAVC